MVGFRYSGGVNIRPVMAALYEDVPANDLIDLVKRPLNGLKIVPYYGCLLVRPPQVTQFDDPDNPQVMASLLSRWGRSEGLVACYGLLRRRSIIRPSGCSAKPGWTPG
jgi:heterodisulfide reductase subunit B